MAARGQDRRVRRTRGQLQRALLKLLEEKELREITVRELTELADVSRGTFYSHYEDLQDLLGQMEDGLFRDLEAMLDAYAPEELRRALTPLLGELFAFVAGNRQLCRVLMDRQLEGGTQGRLSALLYRKFRTRWSALYSLGEEPVPGYCLEYWVAGTVGLVRMWVGQGCRPGAEEMARLADGLIRRGLEGVPGEGGTV